MSNFRIYAETRLPTIHGDFRVRIYKSTQHANTDYEALAMVKDYIDRSKPVALRIHSACFTSEVMGSCKCDCKEQLDASLAYIQQHGGVVIYLPQEGRGIGLADKLRVYAMQEHGYDTIEANEILGFPIDAREYDAAVSILHDLGITRVNLLTNNPEKIQALETANIQVVQRIPINQAANPHSASYLATKKDKMGHFL